MAANSWGSTVLKPGVGHSVLVFTWVAGTSVFVPPSTASHLHWQGAASEAGQPELTLVLCHGM